MGEALLRSHVQALRKSFEALPPRVVSLQRLNLEDNVVEIKVSTEGATGSGGRSWRMNFLIYESDAYPRSGGVFMTDDEQDEELVDDINGIVSEREEITVAEALQALFGRLNVKDPLLTACFEGTVERAAVTDPRPPSSPSLDADDGIAFEEDDDVGGDFAMCVKTAEDRNNRPAWKKMKWQETEKQRVARREQANLCSHRRRSISSDQGAALGHKRRKGAALLPASSGASTETTNPDEARACAAPGHAERTTEEQKAAGEQLWSSQEAFTILANELYQLQTEADPKLEADAIDFDVHQWTVRLKGCNGALAQDLLELKSRCGYDYIELRLTFKEDLHPFYPPSVAVVRPRLDGSHAIPSAIACHPRLQLRGWSPFQTTKDLLLSIRNFLNTLARVDLDSPRNDRVAFPVGAFSPLEQQLAQLESVCEIVPLDLRPDTASNPYKDDPWAKDATLTQTSLGAMLVRRKERECASASNKASKNQYWAAGTGYGHDALPGRSTSSWDPLAIQAAQAAQDDELRQLIGEVTESLVQAHMHTESEAALADLLSKSCLPPFLVRELSISYTNMGDRLPFFHEVYHLVQEVLRALPNHAGMVLKFVRPHIAVTKVAAQTFLQSLGDIAGDAEVSDDVAFAQEAVRVAAEVERLVRQEPASSRPGTPEAAASASSSGSYQRCGASSSAAGVADLDTAAEEEYCRVMADLRIDHTDIEGHAFASTAAAETAAPQARTLRLAKELAGLGTQLPLSGSASVFVRVDSARQQLWRVLVTGPDDTPYSGGCFIFDAYFPPSYPMVPPQVKMLTTGNNMVTFNPNLYDTGKVCLSLLGTWKGQSAENWDSSFSRMLQVLVSIQSLILVPEPYYNEPGHEREIGTSVGDTRSREYSVSVKENCIRWAMLDHLRDGPCSTFTEVIRNHFLLRARFVKASVRGWVEDAQKHGQSRHRDLLMMMLPQLEEQLDRLRSQALAQPS